MSVLKVLTEGMVERNMRTEQHALVQKWEKYGLLEGLGVDDDRNGISKSRMAVLLENEAKQLLKEASSMAGGNVEGFASVAFPLVRRVFGNLLANDLVAVQPMSLPSGLIFFLDFTYTDTRVSHEAGESIYGGEVVGKQITGGVSLSGEAGEDSFYSLNNGYTAPITGAMVRVAAIASGTIGGSLFKSKDYATVATISDLEKFCQWDPDLSGSMVLMAALTASNFTYLNKSNLVTLTFTSSIGATGKQQVRRLTQWNSTKSKIYVFFTTTGSAAAAINNLSASVCGYGSKGFQYAAADQFSNGGAIGSVVGSQPWSLESNGASDLSTTAHWPYDITGDIPEIDIKVNSIPVTTVTRKLKAKWTPELGQDLNAYHNLDAEVELTSILSENIGLEIDREILNDLVKDATGATLYWSRRPGKFVNRETGKDVSSATAPPDFTGNVSMWYETLLETVNDASARIHRKTLRGGANFMVVSPEVASILEMTQGFHANVTVDDDKGAAGSTKIGNLSRKWDIYVDPYFYRNVILLGRKGSSFLESGYVYAPYVPLQVTPTIFGTEDFVPRKGVMTRYAKKMVRPDMFARVVIQDMLG